jgi:MFS family permease
LINLGDPLSFQLFSLVAILFSFAAVPLALTLTPHPPAPRLPRLRIAQIYSVSPAAVAGCFGAGFANGAFWALAPVYAKDSGVPISLIPLFLSLVVIGGALAQWPMGRLSDRIDRRAVQFGLCLWSAAAAVGMITIAGDDVALRLALVWLFGIGAMPVYWVSFAHANDLAEPGEAVDVSSSLLLLFAIGAIIGPALAAFAMRIFGPEALFAHTATVHVLIALAVAYRITRRAPLPPRLRIAYDALPKGNTPAGFEQSGGEAEEKRGAGA